MMRKYKYEYYYITVYVCLYIAGPSVNHFFKLYNHDIWHQLKQKFIPAGVLYIYMFEFNSGPGHHFDAKLYKSLVVMRQLI